MLARVIIVFACVSAVFAAPLPSTDACKHCLFFHPFQKDNIAYCQAQNLCPIHDDAEASNVLLKVDPSTVPFNTTLSTIGQSCCAPCRRCCFRHSPIILVIFKPTCMFLNFIHFSSSLRFFSQLYRHQCNRHWPSRCEDLYPTRRGGAVCLLL
jgi:hypothetical protein